MPSRESFWLTRFQILVLDYRAPVLSANEPNTSLLKGSNVSLRQLDAELGSVTVLLEWGTAEEAPPDADVSVLLSTLR